MAVAAVAATTAVGLAPAAQAQAVDPVRVVLSGLDGPYDVQAGPFGLLVVTEADGARITAVSPRFPRLRFPVSTGLAGIASTTAPFGRALFVTGVPAPDGADAAAVPAGAPAPASLNEVTLGGGTRQVADLLAHELANNPDGQLQGDPSDPTADALSNPFHVLQRSTFGETFVADGGANDVLAVDLLGRVRTVFVPPTVTTGICGSIPENDPGTFGCDSVPTGLAFGPDGLLHVSAFTSGVPGEGRVYVVDPRTGALARTITGLDGPTGVAVGDDGAVYVSEVTYGSSEGAPPPSDPSTVGRLVRIGTDGAVAVAAVPLPLGVAVIGGTLYSTAFSLAGPGAGQVVAVSPEAFTPAATE